MQQNAYLSLGQEKSGRQVSVKGNADEVRLTVTERLHFLQLLLVDKSGR